MTNEYRPPLCGPSEGVEADAEGESVKEAVQSAYKKAMEICRLFGGCDKLNPNCLFDMKKLKVTDASNGKQKATVIGVCQCGQYRPPPGEFS